MRALVKNITFKTLYALNVQGVQRKAKHKQNRVTAVCLHRVSEEEDYFWDPIRPQRFEQLVQYLLKHYDIIPVEKINDQPGKRPRAVLSFDDGYYDFYTNVLPVLKQYAIPCNHNVVTDMVNGTQDVIWTEKLNFLFNHFRQANTSDTFHLGSIQVTVKPNTLLDGTYITCLKELFKMEQAERNTILDGLLGKHGLKTVPKKMMGWKEIRECVENGVDIGSHTKTHPVLSSIKNDAEMRAELVESKLEIEKNIGRKVVSLAPPNGMYNKHVFEQAKLAGYETILGVGEYSGIEKTDNHLTVLARLNLISEPFNDMVLRVEEVPAKLKQYAGI